MDSLIEHYIIDKSIYNSWPVDFLLRALFFLYILNIAHRMIWMIKQRTPFTLYLSTFRFFHTSLREYAQRNKPSFTVGLTGLASALL